MFLYCLIVLDNKLYFVKFVFVDSVLILYKELLLEWIFCGFGYGIFIDGMGVCCIWNGWWRWLLVGKLILNLVLNYLIFGLLLLWKMCFLFFFLLNGFFIFWKMCFCIILLIWIIFFCFCILYFLFSLFGKNKIYILYLVIGIIYFKINFICLMKFYGSEMMKIFKCWFCICFCKFFFVVMFI